MGKLQALTTNICKHIGWQAFCENKHSSLLGLLVSYKDKYFEGATTLNMMMLSITTFSIMILSIKGLFVTLRKGHSA